jgi:pimeloyl-ACP methyl ester carboxylesterase
MMDVASTINSTSAAVNVLYQHGFFSSAMTWCRMSDYIRARFRVGFELRHSLDSQASYEDQSADLINRFQADISGAESGVPRPGPYVFVAHSNGGLVSRYAAQSLSNPSMIAGVVSVSSPHSGAYLANLSQAMVTAALAVPIVYTRLGCDISGTFVCGRGAQQVAELVAIIGPILLRQGVPVLQEMSTGAPFHSMINSRGDAAYRVAGVQNQIWNRWTMWRLIGDAEGCGDPQPFVSCDGYSRRAVTAIDKNYHHFIVCSVVSGFLGIVWSGARDVARGCASNAAWLRAVDFAYLRLSVGNGTGDGVVPLFSQYYPGAATYYQVLVDDSDSHIGETKSQMTANGIATAINRSVGTPFAQ